METKRNLKIDTQVWISISKFKVWLIKTSVLSQYSNHERILDLVCFNLFIAFFLAPPPNTPQCGK